MTVTVKARYANGVFTPLEPVDLEEGAEVLVSMGDAPTESAETAGDGSTFLLRLIEELHASPLVGEPGARPADPRRALQALPVRPPEGRSFVSEVFADTGY